MLTTFRSYQLAAAFYRSTVPLRLPAHLKNQLLRAASSVAANLAEGYGKTSSADQARFFEIAFASCKEAQAFLDLGGLLDSESGLLADKTAAHIYRLLGACRR